MGKPDLAFLPKSYKCVLQESWGKQLRGKECFLSTVNAREKFKDSLFLCFVSWYLKYSVATVAPWCHILNSLLCCTLLHIVYRFISKIVLVYTGEIWK